MIPSLFFYQLTILGLLWLCVMLHSAWPSQCAAVQGTPVKPIKPRRQRSKEPTPFAGLTHKPHCVLCEHEATHPKPPPPVSPAPVIVTKRRPRQVDTSMHFCPHPGCAYRSALSATVSGLTINRRCPGLGSEALQRLDPHPGAEIAKGLARSPALLIEDQERQHRVHEGVRRHQVFEGLIEARAVHAATHIDDILVEGAPNKGQVGDVGTRTAIGAAGHADGQLVLLQA